VLIRDAAAHRGAFAAREEYLEHAERGPAAGGRWFADLNIVCFRVVAPGLDAAALDALNREVLLRLQEEGLVLPSGTSIGGKFALRASITNHRTRQADLDLLVAEVRRLGQAMLAG
jgi:glutamate/tyrosine decarboxylase-like PLP-dependent enzyme